jgi:hypothetical protein
VLLVAGADPAVAQLTDEDIAALRAQGAREGWTFEVRRNPATERSLDQLCGFVVPANWQADAKFAPPLVKRDLPERFDWRDYDACPLPRDQGQCGSCWAFGTVGPLECNILIKDGELVDLSEQWLVSCNSDGWGCNGGWWAHDYHQWKPDPCGGVGAPLEHRFPYRATDAPCDCPYGHDYLIDNWAFIGDDVPPADLIKQAIYDYGPVSVAVHVNSAFGGYSGGVFNAHTGGTINHAVVLVGWDDHQGSDGVWFLRNSWGTGWGEGGYMRIEYGCCYVGYAACYVEYGTDRPTVTFEYPQGQPDMLEANLETRVPVNILPDTGVPDPNSAWLHYSKNDGETFFVSALNRLGENEYEAVLPPEECYTHVNWYVSIVEQSTGRRITDPVRAPLETYGAIVATNSSVLLEDDFESDRGWIVEPGADSGNWERADPEEVILDDGGPIVTQPGDDHSPEGTLCYVTGAAAGSHPGANDVDGPVSFLFSPVLELEGRDAIVSYWRWFHISGNWDDALRVKISNDGGENWVLADKVDTREEWTQVHLRISDYVTPNDQVVVRFGIKDLEPGSLVEALVDDFRVEVLECVPAGVCPEDVNRDGVVDLDDLSILLGNYGLMSGAGLRDGDIDGDEDVDLSDLSLLLAAYGTTCEW